jgi:hypothetical protein
MRVLKKASQRSLLLGNALEVNPFMESEESERIDCYFYGAYDK